MPSDIVIYIVKPNDTVWKIAQKFGTNINSIASLNPGLDLNNIFTGQHLYISNRDVNNPRNNRSLNMIALSNNIRMLWEQHVYWTRMTIISILENLPDVSVVSERLLENPNDFSKILRPFYGNYIANNFGQLLRSHLVIAAEIINAAKAGDNDKLSQEEKKWYENADDIAELLGSINPYWSTEEWRSMLYEHLSLVKSEAVAILNKKYSESINIFGEIEKQALKMADVMTEGIIKQFS